jgi:hypothetical protein
MSETRIVQGTLAGIMEKTGGWHEIHVSVPGKQYPVKVSTKKQELVELARAAGENVMEWTYTEQDSGTPNPHQPGKNFINRYFEGVAPVGANPAGSVATPASAPKGYTPDTKDRMIVRQSALKAAAEIVAPRAGTSIDPDYDPALEVMRAAARFETWVYRDIDPVPSEAGRPALSEHDEQIPY